MRMLILQTGKENGFTFIEILIVLIVLTVFIAVNLPDFHHLLVSVERRGQIQKVEHFFRALREKSILLHRELEIKIAENGLFCIQESNKLENLELAITGKNRENIIFYPDGTCSGAAFSIDILDRYNYMINVDPVTVKLEWSVFE